MTALNKQALNPAELESALLELKRISEQPAFSTHYARVLRTHIANLNGALEAAEKRIAELEARTVMLPEPISVLHRRDFTDVHRAIYAYPEAEVNAALAAAGIKVKGE
ncbi:TPA: hypothetical protein ACVTEY_000150 [Salmonella enterica subsp. enterica]